MQLMKISERIQLFSVCMRQRALRESPLLEPSTLDLNAMAVHLLREYKNYLLSVQPSPKDLGRESSPGFAIS